MNCSVAQSLSPEVISSVGNSFVNGAYQLDWTLGEPATFTLTDGSRLLTQGFHQNNFTITSLDVVDKNYDFTVFPNPTADIIQIKPLLAHDESYLVELYTVEGKLLKTQSFNFNTTSQIDMTNYDNGTYLLKLKNKENNLKSYQVVKSR